MAWNAGSFIRNAEGKLAFATAVLTAVGVLVDVLGKTHHPARPSWKETETYHPKAGSLTRGRRR
jgi:hypothetical protein